jgi:hypothetical protein
MNAGATNGAADQRPFTANKASHGTPEGRVGQASYFGFAGSTSPVPPHTSQRRRPVPLHSLQSPSIAPAGDLLPVPAQAGQEVALCP